MEFLENVDLTSYNSFHLKATARYFTKISSVDQITNLSLMHDLPVLVLGGGSNVLFHQDVNGYVLHNEIMGKEVVSEDEDHVLLRAGAGENWHGLVEYCIQHGFAGMENLALIPGLVGASPMQNIGAYGVEIKDIFHSLEAYHLKEKAIHRFSLVDCAFGYRESVFKKKYKGQYFITDVTYKLNKKPVFQTSYGAIQQELERMNVQELSIRAIADAVIHIRRSKLPDPDVIGNAGSFFKNPEIDDAQFDRLKQEYPHVVGYPLANGRVKLAAGWMIEHAGWKGFRRGDAGVHEKQALVLVNYGNAKGEDLIRLSEEIMQSISEKFKVQLEREVNII